jgi:hypothetical protein
MAGSSLFANFGRAAKVLALLLFFLPWVTVSCSTEALERIQSEAAQTAPQLGMRGPGLGAEIPIADASGLNMALGQVRMRMPPTPTNVGPPPGSRTEAPPTAGQPPEVPIEIGVIAGAALILLALFGSFLLKGRAGAIAGIGGIALAIGALCYSVFISYPPAVRAALATYNPSGGGGSEHAPTLDQIGQILSVKPAAGFWFVLFLLGLAILFNALAMRKPGATVATPPVGG